MSLHPRRTTYVFGRFVLLALRDTSGRLYAMSSYRRYSYPPMRRAALWFLLPLFMLTAGVCWLVVTLDEPTAPDVARKAGR